MDSYTNSFSTQAAPKDVYNALTTYDGLSSWWTKTIELYSHVGGIATFHFGKKDYVVMKIAKLAPHKEVVWKCVEQFFKIKGSAKTDEWVGTTVKFHITQNGDGSANLLFAHEGLTKKLRCYKLCEKGWNFYLKSLKLYLEKGKGKPYK